MNPASSVELARLAPTGLARLASATFERWPHVALIEGRLLEVEAGRTKRLRVALPPRAGKSELISRFFLAHYVLTFPSRRVIFAAATAALAESYSRKVRDLVVEFGHMFGAKLRPDSRAVDRWQLVQGGEFIAVGAGSSVVGRGADLLVADDVIAGNETATSKAQLAKIVAWFRQDLLTRLEPGGACVVVGTRWAEADVHGVLELEERAGGERWSTVVLPALSEGEGDLLGRPLGAALCPSRFDEAELARIKDAVGSHAFAGLYQQRPVPLEGGLFKAAHAKRYRVESGFVLLEAGERYSLDTLSRFVTADTATSERSSADYTAIAAWGTANSKLFLLDLDMRRLEGTKIAEAIKAMSARHRAVAWIEDSSPAKVLLSFLKAQGLVFRTIKPDTSKIARALPASALLEQGRLILPERAPWLADYERQLFGFPSGAHDDAVDVTSFAAQVFTGHFGWGSFRTSGAVEERRPQNHIEAASLKSPFDGSPFLGSDGW